MSSMMAWEARNPKDFFLFLFMLSIQWGKVSLFTMITKGEMRVLNAGENVTLHCEFHMDRFNLFNNPVLWQKIQYHESSEINIMSYVKDPFEPTGKFDVSYQPVAPNHMMELRIKNLSLEDSGNYSCEVRAPKSALLGHVTHRIFVRSPVVDVAIGQDNMTYLPDHYRGSAQRLSFVEDKPRGISCIAKGGNPPPDVQITVGDIDVTDRFTLHTYPSLSGTKGFRLMQMTTVVRSERFYATANDDGKQLRCRVTVLGLGSQTATARIEVSYAPTVYCQTATAYLGDRNVHITCDVRARPGVNALFWLLDHNGTVVTEGEVVNEYWSINMDRGNGVISTNLYLREARQGSFRDYTLVAENDVAVTTYSVKLQQLYTETVPGHEQNLHHVAIDVHSPSDEHTQNTYNGHIYPRYNSAYSLANVQCSLTVHLTAVVVIWTWLLVT